MAKFRGSGEVRLKWAQLMHNVGTMKANCDSCNNYRAIHTESVTYNFQVARPSLLQGILGQQGVQPRYLVIHVNHFDSRLRRDLKITDFDPDNIQLPQYNGPIVNWRVMSFVCHDGLYPGGGHYWSWRRTTQNKWCMMNDDKEVVTKTKLKFDDYCELYLLFLERLALIRPIEIDYDAFLCNL